MDFTEGTRRRIAIMRRLRVLHVVMGAVFAAGAWWDITLHLAWLAAIMACLVPFMAGLTVFATRKVHQWRRQLARPDYGAIARMEREIFGP